MFGCFSLGRATHIRRKRQQLRQFNNLKSSTKKCYLQLKFKILNFKAYKFYPLMVGHSRSQQLYNQSFFLTH